VYVSVGVFVCDRGVGPEENHAGGGDLYRTWVCSWSVFLCVCRLVCVSVCLRVFVLVKSYNAQLVAVCV